MISTKYAIVIVTYNRVQMLQECVNCAVNQTSCPESIIIVNNASTDGTKEYLENLERRNEIYDIISLPKNIGGAGGFAKGIGCAIEKNVDCVLVIDDDAIIAKDYMEKILRIRYRCPQYKAFAGRVETEGKIDTFHRRNLLKRGLLTKECAEEEYHQPSFSCDIASFCGMVIDVDLIKQIGLPHAQYFIWHDDTEYSLRIRRYSSFLVVTKAKLNHKTSAREQTHPRRYDWKEYYAVRNRILMVREHGNIIDRGVNFADIFIRVIFRNWLFGIIKRDHYDWNYERRLTREAIKNSRSDRLENIIMKREE